MYHSTTSIMWSKCRYKCTYKEIHCNTICNRKRKQHLFAKVGVVPSVMQEPYNGRYAVLMKANADLWQYLYSIHHSSGTCHVLTLLILTTTPENWGTEKQSYLPNHTATKCRSWGYNPGLPGFQVYARNRSSILMATKQHNLLVGNVCVLHVIF